MLAVRLARLKYSAHCASGSPARLRSRRGGKSVDAADRRFAPGADEGVRPYTKTWVGLGECLSDWFASSLIDRLPRSTSSN